MPRNIQPLESLAWLALALAGFTLMLIIGPSGRGWRNALPLWQQRALSLSFVIIATQGFTAGFYAAGAWAVTAFPPEGEASSEGYFAWSLCFFLTMIGLATWLGFVIEDATGLARARIPMLVLGLGCAWVGWRAPPWFRMSSANVIRPLFGITVSRIVSVLLGVGTAAYALFGSFESFHR